MIKLFFHPTPNSMKAALLLEELEIPYELIAVDMFKGEQHSDAYRQINPNGKIPALDDNGLRVFDSHAILLHLAEQTGRFLPAAGPARAETLSWLMMVASGLSPFSGQAAHFIHYAPEVIAYARHRYVSEVERHYRVLEQRLAVTPYLAGDEYTIADMALWGWAISAAFIFGKAGLTAYPHVQELVARISARPAARRALALKHSLPLKMEFDEEARRALFPHNA